MYDLQFKTGFQPYGAGAGIHSLGVKVVEPSTEITNFDEWAEETLDKIAQNYYEEFENVLWGREQFLMIGNGIETEENYEQTDILLSNLSKRALSIQKGLPLDKIHPPFMGWVGEPLVHTGSKLFYENFNFIVCNMPLTYKDGKDIDPNYTKDVFSFPAIIEIGNHRGTWFVFKPKTTKQLELIESVYTDVLNIHKDRICILNNDKIFEISDWAAKRGYRLGFDYSTIANNCFNFNNGGNI